jgi:hypothetical protein
LEQAIYTPIGTEIGRFKCDVPNTTPVYESRWGYHPISRQDCQMLKALHRAYWVSVRQAKRRLEWNNKSPRNRGNTPPPILYPDLVELADPKLQYHRSGKTGHSIGKWRYQQALRPSTFPESGSAFCKTLPDIVRDYNLARTPVKREDVSPDIWRHMEFYRNMFFVMVSK